MILIIDWTKFELMVLDPSTISTPIALVAWSILIVSIFLLRYIRNGGKTNSKTFPRLIQFFKLIIILSFTYLFVTYFYNSNRNSKLEHSLRLSNEALYNAMLTHSEGDRKAQELIEESINYYPCFENLIIQATLLKSQKNYSYALSSVLKAEKYKRNTITLITKGEIYKGLDSNGKALNAYFEAIRFVDSARNKLKLDGIAHYNISGILYDAYQIVKRPSLLDSFLYHTNTAYDILSKTGDGKVLGSVLLKKADFLSILGDKVNARQNYDNAIRHFENVAFDTENWRMLAESYINSSNLFLEERLFEKALVHAIKAVEISKARHDNLRLGYSYFNIGEAYWGLRNHNTACFNYNNAMVNFKLTPNKGLREFTDSVVKMRCQ